jgi:hypothetical protein
LGRYACKIEDKKRAGDSQATWRDSRSFKCFVLRKIGDRISKE